LTRGGGPPTLPPIPGGSRVWTTRADPGITTRGRALTKRPGPARKASSGGSVSAKKPAVKAAKPTAKPAPKPNGSVKKPAPAPRPQAKVAPGAPRPPAPVPGKPVRKGITIVTPKPVKKPPAKKPTLKLPSFGKPLLGPGGTIKKPLITSGPNAPSRHAMFGSNDNRARPPSTSASCRSSRRSCSASGPSWSGMFRRWRPRR